MMRTLPTLLIVWMLVGCTTGGTIAPGAPASAKLHPVAQFPDMQVTGVALSDDGRLFVCFPYWSEDHSVSVAEVMPDGSLQPYPDASWNNPEPLAADAQPGTRFVCVQSVVTDGRGKLWALDPAAPFFEGPVPGGPKLVCIDLGGNTVERVYPFDETVAPAGSYLNDVRIDPEHGFAYITDSGLGALVVVNLETGSAQRVLEDHPSTAAEDVTPVIGGKPWRRDGKTPRVAADGIALSPDGQWLYYHALTGYHLYRVPTLALRQWRDQSSRIASAVEDLGPDAITDGILTDRAGNVYLTALEYDAILVRRPGGEVVPLVIDSRLRWPDTLALGPDGKLYVTTSQVHLSDSQRSEPYGVWRIDTNIKR